MSSNLYWQPPPAEVEEHSIGYLKYEIGKYFDEDYNGGSDSWEADERLIPFLKGIISVANDERKKDAERLIAAIDKYGKVILTIH